MTEIKLLLTSDGFATNPNLGQKFLELVGKDNPKVLYVPTAANVENDKSYTELTKRNLEKLGCEVVNFDLNISPSFFPSGRIDAVIVEGGNTFYLLSRFRETKSGKRIAGMVAKGEIIYVGISAGSIIMGKDISVASPFDENKGYVIDTTGLRYTDRIISPHFQRKEAKIILDYEQKTGNKVTRLCDGQALLINGKLEEIIQ